jgi:Glycosyl hydrolases family 16
MNASWPGFTLNPKQMNASWPGFTLNPKQMNASWPGGKGIWPAFWLQPTDSAYGTWPQSGEIDVFEFIDGLVSSCRSPF